MDGQLHQSCGVDDHQPIGEPNESRLGGPSYILHPIRGIVWATILGTPVAAGIVMAINFYRTGRKVAARSILLGTLVGSVVLFVGIAALPSDLVDAIPGPLINVALIVLVFFLASWQQRQLIEAHIAFGGRMASAWRPAAEILCHDLASIM